MSEISKGRLAYLKSWGPDNSPLNDFELGLVGRLIEAFEHQEVVIEAQGQRIEDLIGMLKAPPIQISTHLGLLPVDSSGMRWLIDECERLLGLNAQKGGRTMNEKITISVAELIGHEGLPRNMSGHLVAALNRARQSINLEIDERKRDINLQLERIIELLNTREKNEAEIAALKAQVAAAVLEEREACAQVAIGSQISEASLSAEWGRQCAAAIRRRNG